ncbi:hypothetical protein Fmac_022247 [Flemingia macrophylla]|uniref:non-specific serine/threonine protein kinase n=1 Tax=Flemingia macrophylla TaxID=520843 RepID=A0ABD1M102_9FABA
MDSKRGWEELKLENLKAVKVVGKGGMGTVFLVRRRNDKQRMALKVVEKRWVERERRGRWEMEVLSRLSHPFLPSLIGSFESPQLLAWALPYCPGGDLNLLRYRQTDRTFSPAVIRFYAAEILCALDHLHSMGIAYRDLKPENVLIQSTGHVTLTDFDLSTKLTPKPKPIHVPLAEPPRRKHRRNFTRWIPLLPPDSRTRNANGLVKPNSARVSPVSRRKPSFSDGQRSNSFVGTEEYVSPEVVRGDGHEFAVDWWALGILIYEMLYGATPFKGKNRRETFRNVLTKSPEFVGKRTPLTDLVERLLVKDPTRRLGYARGAAEIKQHDFFRGVRWDLLTEVVRPPFIPSREDAAGEEAEHGGLDIRDYFANLKQSPSLPDSPSASSSYGFKKSVSLTEF